MKTCTFALGIGLAALGAVLLFEVASTSAEEEAGGASPRVARVQKLLAGVELKLADAVRIAETKAAGRAVAAGLEMEDGAPAYEIHVFVAGDRPRLVEVVVHAKTGKILDVDDDEEDDEDDDDEDEDEDDDEEDDDD